MQIVLALQHCHHPNGGSSGPGGGGGGGSASAVGGLGHTRSYSDSEGGGGSVTPVAGGSGGKEKRVQILHRDLKPDNGRVLPMTFSRGLLVVLIGLLSQCFSMKRIQLSLATSGSRKLLRKLVSRIPTSA